MYSMMITGTPNTTYIEDYILLNKDLNVTTDSRTMVATVNETQLNEALKQGYYYYLYNN